MWFSENFCEGDQVDFVLAEIEQQIGIWNRIASYNLLPLKKKKKLSRAYKTTADGEKK